MGYVINMMKASINSLLLPLSVIFLQQDCLFGQVVAGNVPPGSSISSQSVELRVIENEHDTITFLDPDGDGSNDVQILLAKGNTPSDAPNLVIFRTFGNRYSFCVEEENLTKIIHYNLGDTLCALNSEWGTDSLYIAGCYGGWNCTHDTAAVNDKFIAYKNNLTGETGWIKVSMSLYSQVDQIPVTFTISEMLVLYIGSGIYDANNTIHFDLMPNPTYDGQFVIKSEQNLSCIAIYSYYGQKLHHYKSASGEYSLPDMEGIYFICVVNAEGKTSTRKIIRL